MLVSTPSRLLTPLHTPPGHVGLRQALRLPRLRAAAPPALALLHPEPAGREERGGRRVLEQLDVALLGLVPLCDPHRGWADASRQTCGTDPAASTTVRARHSPGRPHWRQARGGLSPRPRLSKWRRSVCEGALIGRLTCWHSSAAGTPPPYTLLIQEFKRLTLRRCSVLLSQAVSGPAVIRWRGWEAGGGACWQCSEGGGVGVGEGC